MKLHTCIFFFFLIAALSCNAQTFPADGVKLNYVQVMFEYEKVSGANQYLIQVALDDANTSFDNIILQQNDSATATLISGLKFGKKYHWRYAGIAAGKQLPWKGPYYFEVASDSLLSKNIISVIVTKNDSVTNARGLLINDCTHTVIDRAGNLVWYLPKTDWHFLLSKNGIKASPHRAKSSENGKPLAPKPILDVKPEICDLRLTPYGTVTYLEDSFPVESDLLGNKLWKAPNTGEVSGTGEEYYNHDFKRMPNGHYMVLGNELWRKLPAYHDSAALKKKYAGRKIFNGKEYGRVEFATVIEYDKAGKIVWSWNSQNYFDSDVAKPINSSQRFNAELRAHVNAFSVDRNNQFVYIGFRDISRVIKVEKATGKVVDSWGLQSVYLKPNQSVPFHQQHDANILDDSTIAVLNNNDYPGHDSIPSVLVFSQKPVNGSNVVWKFNCTIDSFDYKLARYWGNVDQLPNGNFLVCMGNLDRIFEVTRDKKVVWQAKIRSNNTGDITYTHRLYRTHYVSSLYPCYFTFQTDVDTINKKSPGFSIKLFNKGSENDSYSVKVSLSSGKIIQQFNTQALSPNQSATLGIKPVAHLHKRDKIVVTVNSHTNPDFEHKHRVAVVK